ncbi:MAG TPA: hypothetical protein VE052_01645 [Gemmatimonadaceae bacterium]|nr:hypothetical protein [Gemmatimonadaceae bacterium]
MMSLSIAAWVAALVVAVWPLIALRRWTRLHQGRETLRAWGPAVVIPAHAAVAFLWLWMFFDLPWTFYILGSFAGRLWIIPARLALALLLILIPGGLVILDAAWLRLHPMGAQWTLGRIWGAAALIFISSFVMGAVVPSYILFIAFLAPLLLFTVVAWLFLTAWWVVSHPLPE